jgi:hypothetical protein
MYHDLPSALMRVAPAFARVVEHFLILFDQQALVRCVTVSRLDAVSNRLDGLGEPPWGQLDWVLSAGS